MRISDWSSDVCSSDLRVVEVDRRHQLVGLGDQRTQLGRALLIVLPAGIGLHRRALLLAVGGVLVDPDVDVLVGIARLGAQVDQRLAQMPGLRRLAVFLIDLEVGLQPAGLYPIGTDITEHLASRLSVLVARSEEQPSELKSLI